MEQDVKCKLLFDLALILHSITRRYLTLYPTLQQITIAPFLPFQQEDLKSILRDRIQYLSAKYEGLHWKRLQISNIAIDYFLSTEHVEYFDLYGNDNDPSILTFSLRGANSLQNALVHTLHTKLISGSRRRPYKVAFVDVTSIDDERWETVLEWCEDNSGLVELCEEEWRLELR